MYGLIIVFAILVAALYAEKIAKKQSKNTNILWGALFIGLIFGVIGARLFHVLDLWPYYLQHPTNILKVWYGGLGIFGGILFGGLAGACYLKLKHEPLLPWFDIAALALPLGQALGRFANYANDELLPFALYESALDFALFLILNLVYKYKSLPAGCYLALYLIGYSMIRLLLAPTRIDAWFTGGLAAVLFVAGCVLFVTVRRKSAIKSATIK